MRAIGLAILALLCGTAQAFTPDVSDLPGVPQMTLDAKVVKSAIASAKNQPLQFAVGASVGATVDSGIWDEPEAGVARWRLRVHSAGASSLNFAFSTLTLPKDATLYLYTDGGRDVQGPYTSADNGEFVSPIVRSDTAVFEARMPTAERSGFVAKLATAFHAYRDITSKSFTYDADDDIGTGASGACEVNVACSAGDDWRDDIRAVVLVTVVSGSYEYLCSGTLLNNAEQDDRALVLTAHHCEITASNVAKSRAYFNVEASACSGGTAGSVSQNIAGKTLIAGTSGTTVTDYTLFELASVPPSSYDVYYAGWEISSTAPTSGVVIHHPAADDKKISTYTTTASAVSSVDFGDFKADTWSVTWSEGATEEGSSGSGLLNENHRVVGTLSGGSSECSGTSNNGAADYFARLDKAWTATSSTGTTLETALASDSGCTTLDGKDAGTASTVDCSDDSSDDSSSDDSSSDSSSTTTSDSGGGGGGSCGVLFMPLALAALWRRRKTTG
ncbi:MAG: trypsin-like peptidase domain-containing protein [Solimonas sp.]